MQLPQYVKEAIEKLEAAGFEAYVVGGCIRDSLLGLIPHDFDITTSALPDEVEQVFNGYRIVETGIKHGTVTVIIGRKPLEITTFRVDGQYLDNRRPSSVTFTRSLRSDLERRDFTVNAMAYNERTGLIDCFGGISDLRAKLIRCVGVPSERFDEDGLRILRALRFASVYNFDIEPRTDSAIHEKRALVGGIAPERIRTEFDRLMLGSPAEILVKYVDVIGVFIPELLPCVGFEQHSKYHDRDIFMHTIAAVSAAEPVLTIRMAMLLHDLGKPSCYENIDGVGHFKKHAAVSAELAAEITRRLRYDRATADEIITLVKTHDLVLDNSEKAVKKYMSKYGKETLEKIVKVHICDDSGKRELYKNRIPCYLEIFTRIREIEEKGDCFCIKNLDINGLDIMKLGYHDRPVGRALSFLLNAVICGDCPNTKKELIDYLENNKALWYN